jgi:hypothetical protein
MYQAPHNGQAAQPYPEDAGEDTAAFEVPFALRPPTPPRDQRWSLPTLPVCRPGRQNPDNRPLSGCLNR